MLKKLKQLLLTLILCIASIQIVYSIDNPSTTKQENEAIVCENFENLKIKSFIEVAKKVALQYRENPDEVKKKLATAKSDSAVCIISSCNGALFFELMKFRLKNKQLFLKLGYILLNLVTEIKPEHLQAIQLSNKESADLQDLLTYISSLVPNEAKNISKSSESPSPAKNENIRAIMQKINPALTQLFEYNLGLENSIVSVLNDAFEEYLFSTLSESEVKDLHTFITKKNGAFDAIVGKIDPIWENVIKCLS